MHASSRARPARPAANSPSLAMAEVAADFPFSHRSSDQDYLEIAPNDADGLVTSCRYLVYNSWYRKLGAFRDLARVPPQYSENPYPTRGVHAGWSDYTVLRLPYRGFKRKADHVLGYNIITVPQLH
jgi:hypothetical protein